MVEPTKRLRAMKQAYNSNPNAWGGNLNDGALEILDEGMGVSTVEVNDDVVLDKGDYIIDDARRLGLILYGDGGYEITAPPVDKPYLVYNGCDADVTLLPEGGTGAVIRAGSTVWWMTDGEVSYVADPTINDLRPADTDIDMHGQKLVNVAKGTAAGEAATLANEVGDLAAPSKPLAMNGQKITGLTGGTSANDAATKGQVDAIAGSASAAANSASQAQQALDAINSKFTISTQAPSGGSDGDVWFRIA
jgi:hypothetical protein